MKNYNYMKTRKTDKLSHTVINIKTFKCSEIRLNFLLDDINDLVGKV